MASVAAAVVSVGAAETVSSSDVASVAAGRVVGYHPRYSCQVLVAETSDQEWEVPEFAESAALPGGRRPDSGYYRWHWVDAFDPGSCRAEDSWR